MNRCVDEVCRRIHNLFTRPRTDATLRVAADATLTSTVITCA